MLYRWRVRRHIGTTYRVIKHAFYASTERVMWTQWYGFPNTVIRLKSTQLNHLWFLQETMVTSTNCTHELIPQLYCTNVIVSEHAPFRETKINKRELLDHSLWLATSHVKQLQKLSLLNLPNSHHKFIPQNVEPLWCTKRQDCLLSCQLTTCSATLELATSSHLKTR